MVIWIGAKLAEKKTCTSMGTVFVESQQHGFLNKTYIRERSVNVCAD